MTMNQYIFDSHLAKITMPGARELVNWENHDINFILIRHYECLRVLVNKFKYSLGVQMLTKRGVEHCGSKKYVELMKKKFASSYKFKEMLDDDHEDLVNLEGPHLIVPEHVTARDQISTGQHCEMLHWRILLLENSINTLKIKSRHLNTLCSVFTICT